MLSLRSFCGADEIPESVGQLNNLTELSLGFNQLGGKMLSSVTDAILGNFMGFYWLLVFCVCDR